MKKRKTAKSTNDINGGKLDQIMGSVASIDNRVQKIDTRTQLTSQAVTFVKERIVTQEKVNAEQERKIQVNSDYRVSIQSKIALCVGLLKSKPVMYIGGGSLLAILGKLVHHILTVPGH